VFIGQGDSKIRVHDRGENRSVMHPDGVGSSVPGKYICQYRAKITIDSLEWDKIQDFQQVMNISPQYLAKRLVFSVLVVSAMSGRAVHATPSAGADVYGTDGNGQPV
jgi:hypothetical protein